MATENLGDGPGSAPGENVRTTEQAEAPVRPETSQPNRERQAGDALAYALQAVSRAPTSDVDGDGETPREMPSVQDQLQVIAETGSLMHRLANPAEKTRVWEAYVKTINEFRAAYCKLPPVEEIGDTPTRYAVSDAMQRGNTEALTRLFEEERRELAKPPLWKRLPLFNVLTGIVEGGKENVSSLVALADMSPKEIAGNVILALRNLDEVAATLSRAAEYQESVMKHGGETTGHVVGKSIADLTAMVLTGGAVGAAGKAAKAANLGAKLERAAVMASQAAGHALDVTQVSAGVNRNIQANVLATPPGQEKTS